MLAVADYTFSQQREIFAQAEILIGATGSALMSVLFAPSGCRVIELSSNNLKDPTAGPLAHMSGLKHQFLNCELSSKSKNANYKKDFDLIVDIPSLKHQLEEMGLRSSS